MRTTLHSEATVGDRPKGTGKANRPSLNYLQLALLGGGIWLIATFIIRRWGQVFFVPTNGVMMGLCFLTFLVTIPLITHGLVRGLNIPAHQRLSAVLGLALPGLFLDVLTTYWFPQIFPNLTPSAAGPFGAWLLWGYAVMLLTGLFLVPNKFYL